MQHTASQVCATRLPCLKAASARPSPCQHAQRHAHDNLLRALLAFAATLTTCRVGSLMDGPVGVHNALRARTRQSQAVTAEGVQRIEMAGPPWSCSSSSSAAGKQAPCGVPTCIRGCTSAHAACAMHYLAKAGPSPCFTSFAELQQPPSLF